MNRRLALVVAPLLISAISCGGGGGSSGSESNDAASSQTDSADTSFLDSCTETPRADLGLPDGWLTCSDSGLLPPSDGFSFENWGGPPESDAFTPTLAISMFGQDAVCIDVTNGCVLYPAAQQWIDQMNAAIQGGRCEGMAVLSQRLYDGNDTAAQLQSNASLTSDLQRQELTVGSSIARWWASQTFPAVREPTSATRDWTPEQIAARIAEALTNREGVTLGLYGPDAAHAVTPLAVSTDGADQILVSLYDNNYPGQITPLFIDRATQTWSYDIAAANSGTDAQTWSGSTGTLDLTLMKEREVAAPAPWSDDSQTKGATMITVSTGGASKAGVLISAGGQTIDSRNIATAVPGVDIYPFRGYRFGTGATVVISASLGKVTVTPVVGEVVDPSVELIRLTVTIDFPGIGSSQLQGDFDPEQADAELPEISFEGDEGDYSFDVDGSGEFELDVAYGEEATSFDLTGDADFSFEETDDSSNLDLLDAEGNSLWESEFDGSDDDGAYGYTEITFDAETGEFVDEEVPAEAYEIDEELLGWILDQFRAVLSAWADVFGEDFASFFGDDFIDEFTAAFSDIWSGDEGDVTDSTDVPDSTELAPDDTAVDDSSSDTPTPDDSPGGESGSPDTQAPEEDS